MTKIQLAEFRTLRQVFRLLETSQDILARVPVIGAQQQVLGSRLTLIETLAREQEADRTGVRIDKTRLANELVDGIMRVAGPLSAWAALAKQERVAVQSDVTPGSLRKLAAERLVSEAKTISELAGQHLGSLADFGINPDVLGVLNSQIAAFDELVTAPRAGISRSVALTTLLAKEVDAGMEMLRRFFDRIVYSFQLDQPEFFATYQSATRVVRLPSGRKPAGETVPPTPEEAQTPTAVQGGDQEEATSEELQSVLNDAAQALLSTAGAGQRNGSGLIADLTS